MLNKRQSNWELLRIFSMLAIVAGHFMLQSDAYSYFSGSSLFIAELLGNGSRIAVSLFLMLGCWFMVDAKFRAERVLRLYGEMLYYCFAIVVMLLLLGYPLQKRELVTAFFPFTFGPWFVTSYLVLLLLAPWLQKIFQLSRASLKKLIIIQFIVVCLASTIHTMQDTYLDTIMWFCFTYQFIGYYKKYFRAKLPRKTIILGGGMYAALVGIVYADSVSSVSTIAKLGNLASNYLADYKSLPNLLIAFPIFVFFERLNLGCIPWINRLAKPALAVYLIHQGPGIIHPLWFDFFHCKIFLEGAYPLFYSVAVVIATYLLAGIIDIMRSAYVEPAFMRSSLWDWLVFKLNKFYRVLDKAR